MLASPDQINPKTNNKKMLVSGDNNNEDDGGMQVPLTQYPFYESCKMT